MRSGETGKTLRLSSPHHPGGPATVDVSVIICGYTMERWQDICDSVDSVVGQQPAAREIVFVVDHNDELLAAASARFTGPGYASVRVAASIGEKGLSGARNTGVGLAASGIIAFLDDDASAEAGWIGSMAEHFRDPRVFGVGGHATPVWPDARPAWLPEEFDWVIGCSYLGQPTSVEPVRNFLGCNMSLRRSAFELVGGFSSAVGRVGRTPLGCEETELCIRLVQHAPDAELIYDPAMRVRHRVSMDRTRPRYFFRRCYSEGLSKAIVAQLVGTVDGLGSERAYATTTLPQGVLRGLGHAILPMGAPGRRRDAASRAAMIIAGLFATAAGYGYGRARLALGLHRVAATVITPLRQSAVALAAPDAGDVVAKSA